MTHHQFLTLVLRTVREHGAAATLDRLQQERPRFDRGNYHHTRAVFFVWAVDRLVQSGLSDIGVLWHPLVDERSPLVWWHAGVLESALAHDHFVPSTEALPGEPQPTEPRVLAAA